MDGTLIMSKQRSTHLQAYDYRLVFDNIWPSYNQHTNHSGIYYTHGLHIQYAWTCSLKKKKNMRYYCKQSLIFELIFECLQICWIFNHHIHISKCFIYGRYCSFTIENTSICFAITLYINCGQRTPFIYVMILTCFHITSYCSNYSNLIMSL